MSDQEALFDEADAGQPEAGNKYTTKVRSPIYEPKNRCPDILALVDNFKTQEKKMELKKGDVVLFHGSGWLSAAIRRFSTSPGEKRPTVFNHVGIIVGEAGEMVEALSTVRRTDFTKRSHEAGQRVIVARRNGLEERDRDNLALYATRQVGRKYGYGKIAAHFGDWALGQILRTDIYAFRRITDSGRYPICSWVVGFAYYKALLRFCFNGIQPEYCQPDDIGDDIMEGRLGRWEIVYVHPGLNLKGRT